MAIIQPITTSIVDGKFRIASQIRDAKGSRELWFEVDSAFQDVIATDTMDSFVLACLLPAMRDGDDLIVEGSMSTKLYYNITNYLMPILKINFPHFHLIAIKPAAMHGLIEPHGKGVITCFSGGIDSFCNYYSHTGERAPEEYRITHFIYNNVGSHGQHASEEDYAVFSQRYAGLEEFAKRDGKPFIKVNSNLDEIIGMDFQQTHTLRNTAVAMLMQKRIAKFLYASTFPFGKTKIVAACDTAYFDSVILPLMSTERLECIASGEQFTRVEKTELVSSMDDNAPFLDVCVNPNHNTQRRNCSFCWKCMRTELTLSLLGRLEKYKPAFDIDIFRRYEKLYLIEITSIETNSTIDPLGYEIKQYIEAKNIKVSRTIRILAKILPRKLTKNIAKKIIPALHKSPPVLTRIINFCLSF